MAWSCAQCGRNVTSNPLLCDLCGSGAPGADPEKVTLGGQRDLIMEAHLRALAVWHRVGGVLLLVGAVWMFTQVSRAGAFGGGGGVWAGLATMISVVSILLGAGSFVLGHFLGRYSNVARIFGGVLTALSLAWQVIRTGLTLFADSRPRYYGGEYGGYGGHEYSSGPGPMWTLIIFTLMLLWMISLLWAYFNARSATICTDRYRALVAKTPELQPSTFKSAYFLIPTFVMGFLLLLFVVILLPHML